MLKDSDGQDRQDAPAARGPVAGRAAERDRASGRDHRHGTAVAAASAAFDMDTEYVLIAPFL